MRRSAWLHWLLAAYLWLIAWIPLGNWNRQREGTLLEALLGGRGIEAGDFGMLAFVTLPGVLFWVAYRRKSFWFGVAASVFDVVWLVMQIQSWWVPYLLGTNKSWQLAYAKGPTTKVLPSFGNHVAPDGMHFHDSGAAGCGVDHRLDGASPHEGHGRRGSQHSRIITPIWDTGSQLKESPGTGAVADSKYNNLQIAD
ncbi:MAG TPA: hypothetical protein VE077_00525 [Candidatus Methylomirabilis sp.]|nr:hypothetical protein [Candidatus Methylomirabilis sp.]